MMDFMIGGFTRREAFMAVEDRKQPIEAAWNREWTYRSAQRAGSINTLYTETMPSSPDSLVGIYLRAGGSGHFRYCVEGITTTLRGEFTPDEVALAVASILLDRSFKGFKLEEEALTLVQESMPPTSGLLARRSNADEDRQTGADILVEDPEGTVTAAFQVKPKSFLFGRSESLVRDRSRLAATHEQFYESSGIRVYFLFKEDLQRGEFVPQLLTQKVGA